MRERIILAVDTSDIRDAEELVDIASAAGARYVKLGLELSSATSWRDCSDLAAKYELDWVADAKLDDIPNTVAGAVANIKNLDHPPFGITMHTTAGMEAMSRAQEEANFIKMLGVTVLTSLKEDEAHHIYNQSVEPQVMELARMAVAAGLEGIVASPREVGDIKDDPDLNHLFAMIPGTRSLKADAQDQARTTTPAQAIRDGADLLVIGRQVTRSPYPIEAYENLVAEIEAA